MNRETLIEKLKADVAQGNLAIIAGTGISVAACGNQEVEVTRLPRGRACSNMG